MLQQPRRDQCIVYLVLSSVPLLAGLLALWLGQDNSWDLRNYHYYNAFAFLNGRMNHDVAAAHAATYYNPLLHLPFYCAVNLLPPRAVGFLLGLLQGCNIFLLFAIARRVAPAQDRRAGAWMMVAALLGMAGAAGIAELGTSFGDNVVSLLVLAGVWLILAMQRPTAMGRAGAAVALLAGALAGAAFGLKQPFAVYAVGLCAAFLGLDLPWSRRLLLAFIFGLGVLAGLALTGGFWMLELWRRFQNPLFPYFNEYFKSAWVSAGSYRDERFLPRSLAGALLFPLWFTVDPMLVSEVPFRDLRLALLYVLLLVVLVKAAAARLTSRPAPKPSVRPAPALQPQVRFLIIFLAVSFGLWMELFGVYRYLMVSEMLAPLVIVAASAAIFPQVRRRTLLVAGCFVLIAATLQPADWGRSAWSDTYFGVKIPQLAEPERTLVLSSGFDPMAYLIPFFPPEVRFLRVQGYMTGPNPQPHAIDRKMQAIVAAHQGPLYMLYRSHEEPAALEALSFYGLELNRHDCRTFLPSVEPYPELPFCFCRVKRLENN